MRLFYFVFFLYSTLLYSQEKYGYVNSNYAGINAISINPSLLANARVFFDIHIAGLDGFASNNYVFLPPKTTIFKALKNNQSAIQPGYDNNILFKYNGQLHLNVMGPSAMIAYKNHAFGINTGYRAVLDVAGIPKEVAPVIYNYLMSEAIPEGRDVSAKNIRLYSMSWAEAGISYSTIFRKGYKQLWTLGVNINRTLGTNATGGIIRNVDLDHLEEDEYRLDNFEMSLVNGYGYNNETGFQGKGFSTSFGFTFYQMKKECLQYTTHAGSYKCAPLDYHFRFGLSLLDLGYLKYKGTGIQQDYQITQINNENENDGIDITDFFNNYQGNIQFDTLGMRITGTSVTTFSVILPFALSGQFDYNLDNGFYLNTSFVHGLTYRGWLGARRPHSIAITPRYESKKLEASFPIIWYNYTRIRIGFMLRYKWITIGSDNIAGLIPIGKKYGGNAYFHLKLPFFTNGSCGERKTKPGKLKPCPAF